MADATFKENRELIKKRLSHKQRLPFKSLISHNIHNGLTDELREKKPMEEAKRILQLNRKLSHRPQPVDIAHDDDLPPDLKKADTEYYKLYQYRDAHHDIDQKNEKDEEIKSMHNHNPLASNLNWKFGQRSSATDLTIRGIIPESFADVVHGNKSLEEAQKDWQQYRKEPVAKIRNKIDSKFRPTRQDLQDRGIVPDWDNPNILKENKAKNIKSLSMKLAQRMDPHEADQRAIINKDELFSNKDYEQHRKDQKAAQKELKSKMEHSLNQRSAKDEIVFRGIVQKEYLNEDVQVAKHKIKQQRNSVKQQMNEAFGNRPTKSEVQKLYLSDGGDGDLNADQLKREIVALKAERKEEKAMYERDINSLKGRIGILQENENKYKQQIEDILKSKYKLITSTSTEIDALRYKIKMYTQGNWKEVIANGKVKQ